MPSDPPPSCRVRQQDKEDRNVVKLFGEMYQNPTNSMKLCHTCLTGSQGARVSTSLRMLLKPEKTLCFPVFILIGVWLAILSNKGRQHSVNCIILIAYEHDQAMYRSAILKLQADDKFWCQMLNLIFLYVYCFHNDQYDISQTKAKKS